MTARIFAYIAHKGGVADDSAAELLAAAKKIDPAASPTAVVTGTGAELDAVCESLRALLWRSVEGRERQPRLSECRAGSQSSGEDHSGGKRCAGCAQPLWNRSRAWAVGEAGRCVCLGRDGH